MSESPAADQLLLAATKIALPPPGASLANLPEPDSPATRLLAQYCDQCHALPVPGAHSATDWPGVTRRMWLRMDWLPAESGVRVPQPHERLVLLDYLTRNALRVSEAGLPEGPGRDAFERLCSTCHALPDPRTHSAQDWPTVFLRMERNMERMQVRPPGNAEANAVLTYLQSVTAR
jgi:cytochrome c5